MWSTYSFLAGIFVGLLVMLIIGWLTFQTRTFVFAYCPDRPRLCQRADYFNDPGDLAANGGDPAAALFVSAGKLYFRRPQAAGDCTPEKPTVYLANPQFCAFRTAAGAAAEGKSVAFNTPDYLVPAFPAPGVAQVHVQTSGDCTPLAGNPAGAVSGVPLPKWAANRFAA